MISKAILTLNLNLKKAVN